MIKFIASFIIPALIGAGIMCHYGDTYCGFACGLGFRGLIGLLVYFRNEGLKEAFNEYR